MSVSKEALKRKIQQAGPSDEGRRALDAMTKAGLSSADIKQLASQVESAKKGFVPGISAPDPMAKYKKPYKSTANQAGSPFTRLARKVGDSLSQNKNQNSQWNRLNESRPIDKLNKDADRIDAQRQAKFKPEVIQRKIKKKPELIDLLKGKAKNL